MLFTFILLQVLKHAHISALPVQPVHSAQVTERKTHLASVVQGSEASSSKDALNQKETKPIFEMLFDLPPEKWT